MTQGDAQSLSKDEILDIVFWFRCLVSLIFGSIAGLSGLTGYLVIVGYGVSMILLNNLYTGRYLEIDEDDFNP